jgi:hypothetical protein
MFAMNINQKHPRAKQTRLMTKPAVASPFPSLCKLLFHQLYRAIEIGAAIFL